MAHLFVCNKIFVNILLKLTMQIKQLTVHLLPDNTQEPHNVSGCADNDVGRTQL